MQLKECNLLRHGFQIPWYQTHQKVHLIIYLKPFAYYPWYARKSGLPCLHCYQSHYCCQMIASYACWIYTRLRSFTLIFVFRSLANSAAADVRPFSDFDGLALNHGRSDWSLRWAVVSCLAHEFFILPSHPDHSWTTYSASQTINNAIQVFRYLSQTISGFQPILSSSPTFLHYDAAQLFLISVQVAPLT